MKKGKKNIEDEHSSQVIRGGKYRRKAPPSPQVADYMHNTGGIVRHPTAVKKSEHVLTGTGSSKSIRSFSVPSLHATVEKVRYSPPPSPPKPRSKSVRVNAAKKASSFKRNFRKLFGSHLELDENGVGLDEQRVVGTYRPLNFPRPRSIGASSDCSNGSTYTTDFSRHNSLRDSSRSKVSHGNDSVFQGGWQASCDSNDYCPVHTVSGSTDSTLKFQSFHYPHKGEGENMQRSSSSTSLKNFQTKIGVADPRYHSVATDIPYLEDHGNSNRRAQLLKHMIGRQGTSLEDAESLWEDSQSFTFVNRKVVPSDPEYRQLAEELMSVSPTHKSINEVSQYSMDPRRMSDASIDPRRVSVDLGMESSVTVKRNQSLPSTPIAQSFATAHTPSGDVPSSTSRARSTTPHSYLSPDNGQSLPPSWEIAYTEQGLRYYLDHNSQSTHWDLPQDPDDALGLPTGWEAVRSGQYGTYYVNHNNKTAIYQHPYHFRPPPPYQRSPNFEEEEHSKADRKAPSRSHSHRSSQSHRVMDPNSSLLRRSKSVRDQEIQSKGAECVSHERQLSVVTFVPPSPYQSKEIPQWLKQYVEAPFGSELDLKMQSSEWWQYSNDDLTGWDTMIKRLLKKGSEHIVKAYEYYRVAIQQEVEDRLRERRKYVQMQQQHKVLSSSEQPFLGQYQQQQQHHSQVPPQQSSLYYQHHSPTSSAFTTQHQSHSTHPHHPPQLPPTHLPITSPTTTTTRFTATITPPQMPLPNSPPLQQQPLLTSSSFSSSSTTAHYQTPHHPNSFRFSHDHHPHAQPEEEEEEQFNLVHNTSDGGEHSMGKYDTMIEKHHRYPLAEGGVFLPPLDSLTSPSSTIRSLTNGLRRVGSEGSSFSHNSSQSNNTAAPPPHRVFQYCVSDHAPLPKQGSGFSDLFDNSLKETFV